MTHASFARMVALLFAGLLVSCSGEKDSDQRISRSPAEHSTSPQQPPSTELGRERSASSLAGPERPTSDRSFSSAKRALLIGNQNYGNEDEVLVAPIADVEVIARELRALGFATTVSTDLDQQGMEDAFHDFMKTIEEEDFVLFYYAGHGFAPESDRRRNYLLPINHQIEELADYHTRAIELDDWVDALGDKKAAFKTVLLDACRSGITFRHQRNKRGAGQSPGFVKNMPSGENVLMYYSTQAGEPAQDQAANSPHSPFALAFLEALRSRPPEGMGIKDILDYSARTLAPRGQRPTGDDLYSSLRNYPVIPRSSRTPASDILADNAPRDVLEPMGPPAIPPPDPRVWVRIDIDSSNYPVPVNFDAYISRAEITRSNFRAFALEDPLLSDAWKGEEFARAPFEPVTEISPKEAYRFCKWLESRELRTCRLPFEAEWQAVARTSVSIPSEPPSGGDRLWPPAPRVGNLGFPGDGFETASPVGSFRLRDEPVSDFVGNVAEMCFDPNNLGEISVLGSSFLTQSRAEIDPSFRRKIGFNTRRAEVGFRVVMEVPR